LLNPWVGIFDIRAGINMEVSRLIKEHNDFTVVVIGGPHVTAVPVETLNICFCVDICGIYYRENKEIVKTEPQLLIENLDELPLPARHLLDMDFYTRPSRFISRNSFLRATSLFASRGCPFKCNFCAGPVIFPRVRFHSPQYVVEEIEKLIYDYKLNI
jgi:radical SAM superfamily enzyme YgiQ (UPF0313 family)